MGGVDWYMETKICMKVNLKIMLLMVLAHLNEQLMVDNIRDVGYKGYLREKVRNRGLMGPSLPDCSTAASDMGGEN